MHGQGGRPVAEPHRRQVAAQAPVVDHQALARGLKLLHGWQAAGRGERGGHVQVAAVDDGRAVGRGAAQREPRGDAAGEVDRGVGDGALAGHVGAVLAGGGRGKRVADGDHALPADAVRAGGRIAQVAQIPRHAATAERQLQRGVGELHVALVVDERLGESAQADDQVVVERPEPQLEAAPLAETGLQRGDPFLRSPLAQERGALDIVEPDHVGGGVELEAPVPPARGGGVPFDAQVQRGAAGGVDHREQQGLIRRELKRGGYVGADGIGIVPLDERRLLARRRADVPVAAGARPAGERLGLPRDGRAQDDAIDLRHVLGGALVLPVVGVVRRRGAVDAAELIRDGAGRVAEAEVEPVVNVTRGNVPARVRVGEGEIEEGAEGVGGHGDFRFQISDFRFEIVGAGAAVAGRGRGAWRRSRSSALPARCRWHGGLRVGRLRACYRCRQMGQSRCASHPSHHISGAGSLLASGPDVPALLPASTLGECWVSFGRLAGYSLRIPISQTRSGFGTIPSAGDTPPSYPIRGDPGIPNQPFGGRRFHRLGCANPRRRRTRLQRGDSPVSATLPATRTSIASTSVDRGSPPDSRCAAGPHRSSDTSGQWADFDRCPMHLRRNMAGPSPPSRRSPQAASAGFPGSRRDRA